MLPSPLLVDKLANGVFRRHLLMAHRNGASSDICAEVDDTGKQRRGTKNGTWILQQSVSLSN